ncbi:MAG: cysteine--tRNA ligase [Pseudomonadota bacterium]
MADITLYNTRTRAKDLFVPIEPDNVRMYVCGPTVYDRAHIGNARPVVVFDVLYRLLRHRFSGVTYVRNFTDVDDKIMDRAEETGREIDAITEETIGWYHTDMDALGALRPDHEPRCTAMIDQMITMIEILLEKGNAYVAEDHVLFAVESDPRYGRLSRRSVEDMIAGSRVEVAPYKRNPMDFVLWKPSTPDQVGWESPWGRGRPGWHIECSAMSKELLGEVFDIHGGGIDLLFPHHENELAQSCAVHDRDRLANWWVHNEMIRVEGEKMSTSRGNFFTVRDLLDRGIPGEVIRMVLLSTHYRSPLDWTEKRVEEAWATLEKWRRLGARPEAGPVPQPVLEALTDDLNTAKALAEMHSLAAKGDAAGLSAAMALMGLDFPPEAEAGDAAALIDKLLADRAEAKTARDFARADAIRDGLTAAGVMVKDTADGATWELSPGFDPAKLEGLG